MADNTQRIGRGYTNQGADKERRIADNTDGKGIRQYRDERQRLYKSRDETDDGTDGQKPDDGDGTDERTHGRTEDGQPRDGQ